MPAPSTMHSYEPEIALHSGFFGNLLVRVSLAFGTIGLGLHGLKVPR